MPATARRRKTPRPQPSQILRAKVVAARLSQGRLAKITGISQAHISYILSGRVKQPNVLAALRLARALNTTVEAIWGADDRTELRGTEP